ncbi:MAG: SIS domain-containing protein [Alphaproteobacteria bacterium]|jgi:D-sedoheptulose 7-phosphate isomerase|nr:SIS domain-containing protein [Alphaproteobacteria bacterium]MBT4082910.1 SIS domain-containing protein [Alphaproteobacteria bacterium]MBT4546612.1 SIS domain-containing protein [Alphaproteobacteria bacterium]MBT7747078.1 SIS domain-containing protein [Alphaproteobacteria bacterium]
MKRSATEYFAEAARMLMSVEVTDADGNVIDVESFVDMAIEKCRRAHSSGNKVMFVGNGASASHASHMAADFSKNGRIRSIAFNDAAALTCYANDYSYEEVFSKQIEIHGQAGDILVAISSSGESENIVLAARAARKIGASVITLSGFEAGNRLRKLGDLNAWVPSPDYGFVEIAHLGIIHSIVDLAVSLAANEEVIAKRFGA